MKMLRQPIVCVLGHVDSGKTSMLDKIRGSAVALREVGNMTQHIGASFFPLETLKQICGPLSSTISEKIGITGLLVIDTPGHNVFMNLRKRGGSVADIAILVLDILRGFEVQTHESLSILKDRKTPFIVAVNKIDLISGWKKHVNLPFTESYRQQDPGVQRLLDEALYNIIGTFSRLGIKADRFDQISDYTKTVALIPISAKTGEGLPELLAMLIGLTQQYLQQKLIIHQGPGKGTVLEVKEEVGLGLTLNLILYEGEIKKGDTVVISGKEKPIVTKIRTILLPKPLDEIRDPRDKFLPVQSVSAAAGIKISAPNIETAIAGGSIYVVGKEQNVDILVKSVFDEVEKIRIVTDKIGVILKTDTLGSLEAIVSEFETNGIPVRIADIGDVSKREVLEASLIKKTVSLYGVVLSFNVKVLPDAEEEAKILEVPIFQSNIIYHLVDEYKNWVETEKEATIRKELESLILPGIIRVLPNCVFRKSKPAIFGVEVLKGRIKPKYPLLREKESVTIGEILSIQDQGESIPEATIGAKVAISMKEPTVGHHLDEGDLLYVVVPEIDAKKLRTKYLNQLSQDDTNTLEELVNLMRRQKPSWAF